MQKEIIEAFNGTYNTNYTAFEDIKNEHNTVEILQTYLEYEGIVGYTRNVIDLLGECDVFIEE